MSDRKPVDVVFSRAVRSVPVSFEDDPVSRLSLESSFEVCYAFSRLALKLSEASINHRTDRRTGL